MATVTVNGVTYTDDDNATTGLANGGHRTRLVPMFGNAVTDLGAKQTAAASSAAAAVVSKDAAAASALTAVNAPGTSGTSVTSLTIGAATHALTTQTAKAWVVGQWVSIARTAAPVTTRMFGLIASYDSGTGAMSVTVATGNTAGSGAFADWTISLSGPSGPLIGVATGAVDLLTGTAIASAATVNLDTVAGNRVHITGTIAITAWTLTRGPRTVIFDGAVPLTYHATTNRLNSGALNYTTQAGDTAVIESNGTTVFVNLTKVSGTAMVVNRIRSARTANTILGINDNSTLIDITSGTFTQTFIAAATLASGWFCYIRNAGTGDITLDPNGAETIDGLETFIMYHGEVRLVQCDGTALRSVVLTGFSATFITSGTFIKPPGYDIFEGLVFSAGGSGRKDSGANIKTGGGGGACLPFSFPASALAATVTVTVGAGGAAQTVNATNGNAGGTSSFGTASAFGGNAGTASAANGGHAGVSSTLNDATSGSTGTAITAFLGGAGSASVAGVVPKTIHGAGSGGSIDAADVLISAGTTVFGGEGGASSLAAAGTAGTAPGGGGGSTQTGTTSGAGARGELRIWGLK